MQSNDISAEIINCKTRYPYLNDIQTKSENDGLYTPFGYVLKANNILEFLRNKTIYFAENHPKQITVYEDEKVINIDRKNKIIGIQSVYDDHKIRYIKYDKLLITAGPWTNKILSSMNPKLPLVPMIISNEQTQNFGLMPHYIHADNMPLVTFSDCGYVESGSNYWFIVPFCSDILNDNNVVPNDYIDHSIKVGFHRQGDLMNNEEFIIPKCDKMDKFIQKLPHLRKKLYDTQHFGLNSYILDRSKAMISERLKNIDPGNMVYFMRCLYQNTADKEYIIGYPFGINDDKDKDIVIACGFNGGGFQMAPMISRFCLHLLLQDMYPNLVEEQLGIDKTTIDQYQLDIPLLFKKMETQFNPSREALREYMQN